MQQTIRAARAGTIMPHSSRTGMPGIGCWHCATNEQGRASPPCAQQPSDIAILKFSNKACILRQHSARLSSQRAAQKATLRQ